MKDLLIKKYFASNDSFTNKFGHPAPEQDILNAEDALEITLPEDFKTFLRSSDGFEGFVNALYLKLIPVGYLYDNTLDYCSEFFPWAVFLGTNAGGEMVVLDTRTKPYQFGLLPYLGTDEDFLSLGDTFQKFIESLYNDEVFD